MTYQEIKSFINTYIVQNGVNAITGAQLNTILNELADYKGFDSVVVTTLPAGSDATATVQGMTLVLGIPKGADGRDGQDGQDGQNAVNPFKGWFNSLADLKASYTASVGDSAYVKDALPATTWSIYIYDSTASSDNYWADSGLDADTSHAQTFASGEEVNEVRIVNDLTTGGDDNVASAKTVKTIAETTMELVESLNILDPSTITLDRFVKGSSTGDGEVSKTKNNYVYGCTNFIEIGEGLVLNHGCKATGTYVRGLCVYDQNKNFISTVAKNASEWGGALVITREDPTWVYVRFNLYDPTVESGGVAYNGITDGYAIYRATTLPTPAVFHPWHSTQVSMKPQQFQSGEKITETKIDSTALSNPTQNSLAKAIDVKNSVDAINIKISAIDYSENDVELHLSGANQNVFDGYISTGSWTTSNTSKFLLTSLEGVKKIKFLAGEKSTNASYVGYSIGYFTGEPNATLQGWTDIKHERYAISETTRQVEYEVDIPTDMPGLYAAITIWPAAGVTTDNFYCTKISGNTLEDLLEESTQDIDKPYVASSSVGNISIQASKDHWFDDGTPPVIEWFLVEEPVGKFYYSKNLTDKKHLFDFSGKSYEYQFGILPNGDILALRRAESLDDSTQSDSNRTNPFIFKASEEWKIQHEIDFSDSGKIAPCGWQRNEGFINLPNGSTLLVEYTRPSVSTTNCWKITGDASDPANWSIKKSFDIDDGTSKMKHIHCVTMDFYTGTVYLTTGDSDTYSQIWYSLDNGETFTQIEKNPSLNNGQQFRMSTMTFTKDYIVWATDTPGADKHVVYRGVRDNNGVLDSSTLVMLCNLTPQAGNYSSYGQALLPEFNSIFLFDRQDGGGTQATQIPLKVVDLETGAITEVYNMLPAGSTYRMAFRTKYSEWYPINGVIRVGFGFDSDSANYNKVCGNGIFSIGSDRGKTTVNNLCILLKKDGDNWTCRFSTYYV